jgi:glucosyl-3-phosphoglycerate synthase
VASLPDATNRADAVTDRAFAGRTFRQGAFDAGELVARKRRGGETIAVVIPAKDEQATIGAVVAALRPLVDEVGLVDELVVVDSESRDATAAVAAAAGARVVRQAGVLPESGPGQGKGEALWKGLAATSGDLVVFVDADLRDVDDRYVTGLAGPLLVHPELQFVKAAYDRPLVANGRVEATGGGRVTELLVRPLIAAFWPELGWMAQPLAGEYAGRREALEQVPFAQGYGVEIALLVDLLERYGVTALAQADLGRRVHGHQALDALGRMAAEILHVAVERLTRHGRLVLHDALATELVQPLRDELGRLGARSHTVAPGERVPLSDYRAGTSVGRGLDVLRA